MIETYITEIFSFIVVCLAFYTFYKHRNNENLSRFAKFTLWVIISSFGMIIILSAQGTEFRPIWTKLGIRFVILLFLLRGVQRLSRGQSI